MKPYSGKIFSVVEDFSLLPAIKMEKFCCTDQSEEVMNNFWPLCGSCQRHLDILTTTGMDSAAALLCLPGPGMTDPVVVESL